MWPGECQIERRTCRATSKHEVTFAVDILAIILMLSTTLRQLLKRTAHHSPKYANLSAYGRATFCKHNILAALAVYRESIYNYIYVLFFIICYMFCVCYICFHGPKLSRR